MKSPLNLTLATTLCVLLFAHNRSHASTTVALYEFGADASSPTYASTDTDANSNASAITVGSSLTNSGISTTSGNPVPQLYLRSTNNSTEALAFSGSKYISFTVTPVSGTLSFDSLSFDYFRDVAGTPAQYYALYASTTNSFTSGAHIDTNSTAFSVDATFTNYSVSLTSIASLQDVSSAVTFRLYFWGASGGSDTIRLDNITLTTTSIPEPATYALFTSGGLFFVCLFARRRRSGAMLPRV